MADRILLLIVHFISGQTSLCLKGTVQHFGKFAHLYSV